MAIRPLSSTREATDGDGEDPVVPSDDAAAATVGARVRELRKAQGRSLREVAGDVGISVSYLSQIERGVSRLPIGVLKTIADVLGVHINWFFYSGADGPVEERGLIVRAANRRTLSFTGLGITEELLSPNLAGPLELLISTIQPGADSEFYAHDGAEAGMVIEGDLELWIGDQRFDLAPGDSFSFESTTPHRCVNRGRTPTRVFWVVTPPHY